MLLTLHHVGESSLRSDSGEELITYADWTLASRVYHATAEVLRHTFSEEGDPVVVTTDNRLPARTWSPTHR